MRQRAASTAACLLVACTAATAAGPAPKSEGCARWKLNGYAIGMTAAEVSAVRPPRGPLPDEGMVSVEVDGTVTGTLTFMNGRLAEYRARISGTTMGASDLRRELQEKFGKMTRETASESTTRLIWSDPSCDRSVLAEWEVPSPPEAKDVKDAKPAPARPAAYTVSLGRSASVKPYLDQPAAQRKVLE